MKTYRKLLNVYLLGIVLCLFAVTGFAENTLILPQNLKSIKAEAFSGCIGLTEVTIPDGATTIEDEAFFHVKI